MTKYRVEKTGSMIIDAESKEEAEQEADQISIDNWDWDSAEAEEW